VFNDHKLEKKFQLEKKFVFFMKIAIWLSLGLYKGRPSYSRSLHPSKENIQHFKTGTSLTFFYFCGSFLPSWIRIQPTKANPCGSGPEALIFSMSLKKCRLCSMVIGYNLSRITWWTPW
jgi:hypothetical protein